MDVANQMSTWGEWWTDKGTEITDDDIHIKKRGDRQCSQTCHGLGGKSPS